MMTTSEIVEMLAKKYMICKLHITNRLRVLLIAWKRVIITEKFP